MKKLAKTIGAVLAVSAVAYVAMAYKVEVKISERTAAACDPADPSCGG